MLALGSKIAEDIGAEQDRNITGKWIAQYLAERIEAAGKDPTLQDECAELILKFWRSRRHFPKGDPFERYQKLIEGVDELVSDKPRSIFVGLDRREADGNGTAKWLQVAEVLERQSRRLLVQILKQAAGETDLGADELLELANVIDPDSQTKVLIQLKRVFVEEGDQGKGTEETDALADAVKDLQRLLNDIDGLHRSGG